jgi:hypothetical protein
MVSVMLSRQGRAGRNRAMKLLAEYLDRALEFERMADLTQEPALREQLLQQSAAYRKLATQRATQLGLPSPTSGNIADNRRASVRLAA